MSSSLIHSSEKHAAMHRVKTRDRHMLTFTVTHTPHTHTHTVGGPSLSHSWLRGGGTGVKWFKWSRAYTGANKPYSPGGIFQGHL